MAGDLQVRVVGANKGVAPMGRRLGQYNNAIKRLGHSNNPSKRLGVYNGVGGSKTSIISEMERKC
jgi:hypothetical protein